MKCECLIVAVFFEARQRIFYNFYAIFSGFSSFRVARTKQRDGRRKIRTDKTCNVTVERPPNNLITVITWLI